MWYKVRSLEVGYLVLHVVPFSALFVEKTVPSPLKGLGTLIKSQLAIYVKAYF